MQGLVRLVQPSISESLIPIDQHRHIISVWFYSVPIQISNDFLKHTCQILLISCFCISCTCPAGNLLYLPTVKHYRKRNPHGRSIPSLACSGEWNHSINSAMNSLSEVQIQPQLLPQHLALALRTPASNAVILLGLLHDKSITKICRKKNECNISQGHPFTGEL